MKVLYFLKDNFSDSRNVGIFKKVFGQIRGLRSYGHRVDLCHMDGKSLVIRSDEDIQGSARNVIRYKGSVQREIRIYQDLFELVSENKYDAVYLRYARSSASYIRFLSRVKKISQSTGKIIIDLPAFPYDDEFTGLYGKFKLFVDRIYRKRLSKYVDRIVNYNNLENIYSVPGIPIGNGIDVNEIPRKPYQPYSEPIHLLAVANVSYWHGLDRVILGLAQFHSEDTKKDLLFHIVGDGNAIPELRQMVIHHGLEDVVIFHGKKTGRDLDEMFEQCDLGIGSIANHRKNMFTDSALKNREYCCRAIPFVLATYDADFPEGTAFVHYIPDDETPVNIAGLIDFLKEYHKSGSAAGDEEHRFAVTHLGWESKMGVVSKYLQE